MQDGEPAAEGLQDPLIALTAVPHPHNLGQLQPEHSPRAGTCRCHPAWCPQLLAQPVPRDSDTKPSTQRNALLWALPFR